MKNLIKESYDVITKLWNETEGKYKRQTTTFESVQASFTFANKFINGNADKAKDEVEVRVYDNEGNKEIYVMTDGKERYGDTFSLEGNNDTLDYKAIMEEIKNEASAIKPVDTASEITAVTAVCTNYASGVYRWYYKNFDTKVKAFNYLWNKRKNYKGTTEFIFQIEVDGETIFNFESATKDNSLEIKDEEIRKLYDGENTDAEETVKYRTNRGNIRELKIAETFGTTPQRFWEIQHEIAGLPEEFVIENARNDYGDEFATQLCKFIVNDTDGTEEDTDEEETSTTTYNFDAEEEEDDELVDEPCEENAVSVEVQEEVKAEENVIDTADLETQLNAVKAAKEIQTLSNASAKKEIVKRLIECYRAISKYEDELWDAEIKHETLMTELNEKATALEAEIFNRKIIDAYTESLVTVAAIDASTRAEENLAFDAQRFNTPPIDEDAEFDAEIKKVIDEVGEIDAEIKKLQAQITELENERAKKRNEFFKKENELNAYIQDTVKFKKISEHPFAGLMISIRIDKRKFILDEQEMEYGSLICGVDDRNGIIKVYHATSRNILLVEYKTTKAFKAAINGLAAAIKRGDAEFTFPADDEENTANA